MAIENPIATSSEEGEGAMQRFFSKREEKKKKA